MEFLLWALVAVIVLLVVSLQRRKVTPPSARRKLVQNCLDTQAPSWSDSSTSKPSQGAAPKVRGVDAAVEARHLAEEIHRERDAAFAAPPGSAARNEGVEHARVLVGRLRALVSGHPALSARGLDAMLHDLDAIKASDQRAIQPRASALVTAGPVVVAFLDTETTGLGERDEVVSLGIVLAEVVLPKGHLLREMEAFYSVREPSVPINPGAQAVHGLSAEALKGKAFDLPYIRSLIDQADVLVAHNASFDRRMLERLIPDVAKWPWRCSYRQVGWPEGLANKKLDTICMHFHIERQQPHNALSDARAMMDCLLMPTGKTVRSRSYLAGCLLKSNF